MKLGALAGMLLSFVLFSFCTTDVYATTSKAEGTLTATQACPAYSSKRRMTNPGEVSLETGVRYQVIEADAPENAGWYRIRVEGANPSERWVEAKCGNADVTIIAAGTRSGKRTLPAECSTAGLEDSYVFALSWQRGFCAGHPDKPECKAAKKQPYMSANFTLHGLWPNKKSCGINYGFCGEQKKVSGGFCNYPPVPMDETAFKQLEIVMPSAAAGTCLQRHEWYKHGTCQTDWNASQYYEIAVELTEEFNYRGMAAFMNQNMGKTVQTEDFFELIDRAFGDDAHKRFKISCKGGRLVDVYINLPKEIDPEATLAELIMAGGEGFRDGCGGEFGVVLE